MTKLTHYVMPSDKGEMAATPAEQFSRRVRELMLKKGWTQSELARRASVHMPSGGIDRQLISAYLRGKHLPHQGRLEAVAKALEVDPFDLVRSPMVAWMGSGVAPGGAIGNAPRLPRAGPVQAAAREGGDMSFEEMGGEARLRIDKMVPIPLALQIMGLLSAGGPDAKN